jgi:UDP-glucose 4-epimerase
MKKIDVLVTGGAGYIGSHTLVELHNSGYRPIIADNLSNTSLNNIKGAEKIIKNNITFYEFDCTDEDQMNELFKSGRRVCKRA